MFLLSSAKVALTNMGPRAKPRVFSVSLTQNFQRGRHVWKTQVRGVTWHCLSGRRDSGVRASVQNWRETFPDPAEVILGPGITLIPAIHRFLQSAPQMPICPTEPPKQTWEADEDTDSPQGEAAGPEAPRSRNHDMPDSIPHATPLSWRMLRILVAKNLGKFPFYPPSNRKPQKGCSPI